MCTFFLGWLWRVTNNTRQKDTCPTRRPGFRTRPPKENGPHTRTCLLAHPWVWSCRQSKLCRRPWPSTSSSFVLVLIVSRLKLLITNIGLPSSTTWPLFAWNFLLLYPMIGLKFLAKVGNVWVRYIIKYRKCIIYCVLCVVYLLPVNYLKI